MTDPVVMSMAGRRNDPKSILARGYDRIAERYAAWTGDAWAGDRAHYGVNPIERLLQGALVAETGLDVLETTETTKDVDGLPATFLWIVARKPDGSGAGQ